MATSQEIATYKAIAQAIKDATTDGENTAQKVGGVLIDIINALISDETLDSVLSGYATTNDIPDVSGFATTETAEELKESIDGVSGDLTNLQNEAVHMETTPSMVGEILYGTPNSRYLQGSKITINQLVKKSDFDTLSSEVGDMIPAIQDNANDIADLKDVVQPIYTIPCLIMDGAASVQINALSEGKYANGVQVVLRDTYTQTNIPLQYMYDENSGTLHFWFVAFESSYGDMAVWRGQTDDILGASKINCTPYILN